MKGGEFASALDLRSRQMEQMEQSSWGRVGGKGLPRQKCYARFTGAHYQRPPQYSSGLRVCACLLSRRARREAFGAACIQFGTLAAATTHPETAPACRCLDNTGTRPPLGSPPAGRR